MRIGLDFDNTIVDYDELFHRVAVAQRLIPTDCAQNKLAVRDYLRAVDREDEWTELQGHVYGSCMNDAPAYLGAIAFAQRARTSGHELFIISHKTQFPFLGPKHDLHVAARSWIAANMHVNGTNILPDGNVFFELTKEQKMARIAKCDCDVFVDDLPEILLASNFPARTMRLLFDPEQRHHGLDAAGIQRFNTWSDLDTHFR